MKTFFDRRPWLLLAIGTLLLAASQVRFGIGALAWLAPIPWLAYLRGTSGPRSRLLFLAAALFAWHLAIAKIVTAPLSFGLVPMFAVPLALSFVVPYLAWSFARRHVRPGVAPPLFAAAVVLSEWPLHALLPFGTWGSVANTNLESLPLLQLASVTGMHGVSFLVSWLAAAAEEWHSARGTEGARRGSRQLALAGAATVAIIATGALRLALASGSGVESPRVAAVGTDATFSGLPLPSPAELEQIDERLLERTRLAARAGARLVAWTEAATLARPEDEARLLARVQATAARERVYVAAAYVVPVSLEPLRYRNQYVLVSPEGSVLHDYLKHRPVPGEPAVPGLGPAPIVDDPVLGRISGAICVDYNFPRLALDHARSGVNLVVLPSSDWRGIDPIHTQMAALRSIETGASVLRPTRFGLSAGIDPYGRMRGWQSHWDGGDRVLLVQLPARRVPTLYGLLGDWFPAACALWWVATLALALRRGVRASPAARPEAGALPRSRLPAGG